MACSELKSVDAMIDRPLVVFADDWGRHPSSCQHIIRHLLPQTHVYWVNTIGTRSPKLNLATMRRGFEKAGQWFRPTMPSSTLPAGLTVLNPKMWPWYGSSFGRALNKKLLRRQLDKLIRSLPASPLVITTISLVADLIDELAADRWIYYCVDDFSAWPGLEQGVLREMEQNLVRRADVVIAVSEMLQAKLASMGRSAHLLTHGVDVKHWSEVADGPPLPQLRGLEPPLIVFWGVIDRRMDVAMLRRLAGDLATGTIVLAGPECEPDPALFTIRRVVRVGSLPFEQLPYLARTAAVLVMPYTDAPVTRAIQPLKLKEYLATGRPVVVRDLPANRPWADCLDLVTGADQFSQAVRLRIAEGLPTSQRAARSRLNSESWQEKARAFVSLLLAPQG